ncbi:MAG: S-adenosylmethionine:tRNA ribosyltransferase-isomerase [Chloroflexota bacterium]|nr:S-adenosylmethionine:tRNA ribosyltransferase-isomerase [Chloroflexota bacterium]
MIALAVEALPSELRASLPPELRGVRRDRVRLLVVDRAASRVEHRRFNDLLTLLDPGDLLVVNSSRTLPAAVPAVRRDGTPVQLRPCVRRRDSWDVLAVQTEPPHENVALIEGEPLRAGGAPLGRVVGRRRDIPFLWRMDLAPGVGIHTIASLGEPIRYSYVPRPVALEHYQTVYAMRPGSAEPPSAGRPFSWELLLALRGRGVGLADVVLHAGLSSYQDDAFDLEHRLYEEWFEVGDEAVAAVTRAKRVVAVGTTVVRALETAGKEGGLRAASGWTDLRISPTTTIRHADAMITGLHEPQASHWELLEAFVDAPLLRRAYDEARERRYLWHEFGDAMLIV